MATFPDPLPPGRGMWRLVAQSRQFAPGATPTVLAELTNARGRQLTQAWDSAAMLTFTLDGHDPEAAALVELQTDVVAYRWDRTHAGAGEVEMFRGIVAHSEDEVSEQDHVVIFQCYDYLKMLERRLVTQTIDYSVATIDQDSLVALLISTATNAEASSGASLAPGSYLPLDVQYLAPDGSPRVAGAGVPVRNRTYLGSTQLSQALDDLAKVEDGFDYDVVPGGPGSPDHVRVFYPQQGETRTDPVLAYGANVASLTRTVNSGDYSNYWRTLGNSADVDPLAPQLFAETWNGDANDVTRIPVGLWMTGDNAADVSIQSTLDEQAAGDLELSSPLIPSYTLALRPGWWTSGAVHMGDVVPLVVRSGRLNVNASLRVLGIEYDIGDDGQEDITLTVGRQPLTFTQLVTQADRTTDALTRR
jgi:hypothetical protein